MLSPRKKTDLLVALPRLYELNYQALLLLIPNLHQLKDETRLSLNNIEHLSVTIHEQCRYTTIMDIGHLFNNALLPDLTMTIRVYHDAQMAEVTRYQKHSHFKPSYHYPNKAMYQPLEKRQTNLFFEDWLKHCTAILYQQGMQKTQQKTSL